MTNLENAIEALEAGDLGCACEWLQVEGREQNDVEHYVALLSVMARIAARDIEGAVEALREMNA